MPLFSINVYKSYKQDLTQYNNILLGNSNNINVLYVLYLFKMYWF